MFLLRDAPARTTQSLVLPDGTVVEVLRVRDARARRLRLIVSERGVRLTLPRRASERSGDAFLDEHRPWIAAQLAKRAAIAPLPALLPGQCEQLMLRGESVPVMWKEGRLACAALGAHGIEICAPANADPRRLKAALRELLLAEARSDVGRWLPRYLPDLPRPPSQLRVRPLQSLWGSLSPSAVLSLDLSLLLGRPSAFEYVLVHELCHLLHANHSKAFWREVEARWPQWRDERDYLRGEGLNLKATLRALVG
ncbi:MAG TPA: SprT family zinc-dependent metalloprotease [Arenimonas sp.]|nr:SprT family zinc-dependent metalloprotease [Arenimonas sp.]